MPIEQNTEDSNENTGTSVSDIPELVLNSILNCLFSCSGLIIISPV